jgi:ADP-ribosyl-[dinitrogen reductase] hydrolase
VAERLTGTSDVRKQRDTAAAIVGQLGGAHYAIEGIPPHWLERLWERKKIQDLAGDCI